MIDRVVPFCIKLDPSLIQWTKTFSEGISGAKLLYEPFCPSLTHSGPQLITSVTVFYLVNNSGIKIIHKMLQNTKYFSYFLSQFCDYSFTLNRIFILIN